MEDKGGSALGEAYNALPCPVNELIRCEPCLIYKELDNTVLALDISNLHNGASNYIHDKETVRLTRVPPSPIKAIQDMLSAMYLHTPQHKYQQTDPTAQLPSNPFANLRGRGNLFQSPTQQGTPPFQGMNPGSLGIGQGTGMRRPPS